VQGVCCFESIESCKKQQHKMQWFKCENKTVWLLRFQVTSLHKGGEVDTISKFFQRDSLLKNRHVQNWIITQSKRQNKSADCSKACRRPRVFNLFLHCCLYDFVRFSSLTLLTSSFMITSSQVFFWFVRFCENENKYTHQRRKAIFYHWTMSA